MPDPYEIATERFERIAPLIDLSLDPAQRQAAWRERTANTTRSTLYRWIKAYRKRGYVGLLPEPRKDRDASRKQGTSSWIAYAIGLLYEQPGRSLTQLAIYLQVEFPDYDLSSSSLSRHLRKHPAYAGIGKLRSGKPKKLRDRYEASHPHEGWQLDGKGPFSVRLTDGTRARVHVLSILDDYSRAILASVIATAESTEAAIRVFERAALQWGLADRFQFDHGSAFDSHAFRHGLAQLGVHRNAVAARNPEAQGKIEAYHRSLGRWFVDELAAQEVVDLEHLQQLLDATLALVYGRHHHREIGTSPDARLAGRVSDRSVSLADLQGAFFVEATAKSEEKTGAVHLPNGTFRVPTSYAGVRSKFRHHPVHEGRAVLVARDGREIELQRFGTKPLSALKPQINKRGTGQLQKLLDQWQGRERPNTQPGFGLPEVFVELGKLLGRSAPNGEREARSVASFYREHGPLPREGFAQACARAAERLGAGRPLAAYLDDLARQITTSRTDPDGNHPEQP